MSLEKLKGNTDVLKSMIDYLYVDFKTGELGDEINDVGYIQEDIDECGVILDKYIDKLISISEPRSNEQILLCVEKVVKDLNSLNEKCDYSIIETDQREDLVLYIINAASLAGLVTEDEDITEEWREW